MISSLLRRFVILLVVVIGNIMLFSQNVAAGELKVGADEKIRVYYFHGNVRCVTCNKIEELTEEAVVNTFGTDLSDKNVVFESVNVEEGDNEHFISDYQLMVKCVVIAIEKNGKEVGWKKLDKVWNYHSDKDEFFNYFKTNIIKLMKDS